jgi:hypothetical protein
MDENISLIVALVYCRSSGELCTAAGDEDQVIKARILRLQEKPACRGPSNVAPSDARLQ